MRTPEEIESEIKILSKKMHELNNELEMTTISQQPKHVAKQDLWFEENFTKIFDPKNYKSIYTKDDIINIIAIFKSSLDNPSIKSGSIFYYDIDDNILTNLNREKIIYKENFKFFEKQ